METASDEQLVERALAGDAEAFGEIMRRWERRIFLLACGMLGSEDAARDATQETFLSAYRNLRNFRREAKVSSWLHRIAVNQCISYIRRGRVRAETSLDGAGDHDGEPTIATVNVRRALSPIHEIEEKEREEAVRRAVNALPPELRQVIIMKEFEEMTFQEIAETLQLPVSTVKSRLYTALKQLRMRLERFVAAEEEGPIKGGLRR